MQNSEIAICLSIYVNADANCQVCILRGNSKRTKYHRDISGLKVVELQLTHPALINSHNHVKIGSMGLEDLILTKSPYFSQFTGILGFLFTNSYVTYKYFKLSNPGTCSFQNCISKLIV